MLGALSFTNNFLANRSQLYFAGESYAGTHIPYIARAILDRNKSQGKDPWNLRGLLIGNGWISPTDQYLSYLPFSYKMNLLQSGTEAANKVESQQALCVKQLDESGKDHVDTPECEEILHTILRVTKGPGTKNSCINMYDIRLRDDSPSCGMSWPPDLADVTPYLRQAEVIQALHVDKDKNTGWVECNGNVGSSFRARKSRPSFELLPGLLSEVNITLFSGDQDLICNHLGTEELINNLQWNGGKGMELTPGVVAPRRDWTFEDEPAGFYQEARNLTYILFYNASHMVPFDYPRRSRDMLDRFLGVDIASIGGRPADSRLDGEKGPPTSVGAHPNSTAAEQEAAEKLQQATWRAYYKSGEVALVVVAFAAGLWGWFVWRDRRRRRRTATTGAGYRGLFGDGGESAESFRHKRAGDVEAADFDENELDDLGSGSGSDRERRVRESERERYSIGEGSDSDEDGDAEGRKGKVADGREK